MAVIWPDVVAQLVARLFVILGPILAVVAIWLTAARWWRRSHVPATAGAVALNHPQPTHPLAQHLEAPEPRMSGCPVCGAELPGDTPEGLCPQCLMQCVLSRSDHALPEEEGDKITPPNLPAAPTPAELAAHFPQLEILQLLGQGGMGAVYKARQRKLDRLVAVKILPLEWGRDPAFADRFTREARALARLNHPQVVSVHDFGEAGGHYFLIMEFVDGANLRQLLASGRLQPRQALAIVAQVCEALDYAHEQGVVHRDIKPENILLDKRGRVKIADFGLAKLVRRSRSDFTLTGSRQVMGTLDYMAPEQRLDPQSVDHRADIYSLGVVFYEMLTGELPLGRFAAPSERASVDGRLDEVIFRALQREPDRRYQRISAVKEDVESILRAESWTPAAGSPERWEPDLALAQLQTRGPAVGLLVVAALTLIEVAVVGVLILTQDPHYYRPPSLRLLGLAALPVFALIGAVVAGAVKLARCRGYEWVMLAIILSMLPFGYHFLIGFPIGCWALVVLRRPEVKAAFALDLRRAHRMGPAPALVPRRRPARQPTGPIRRGVRAFFLSAFSMFVPRSVLGRRATTDEAAPVSQPPGQPSPEAPPRPRYETGARGRPPWPVSLAARCGWRSRQDRRPGKRLLLVFLVVGFVVVFVLPALLVGLYHRIDDLGRSRTAALHSATTAPPKDPGAELLNPRPAALLFNVDRLTVTPLLSADQIATIRQILHEAEQEYLALERRHASRRRSIEPNSFGHVLVTISPFREEVISLEDRVWSKLDSILNPNQRVTAKKQLPPHGELFAFGHGECRIEIWDEGAAYHWKIHYRADNGAGIMGDGSSGARLPAEYQRFWQDGPP